MILRLKFERVDRQLSLEQMADLVGVRSIDLSLIERGRLIPSDRQLAKIGAALSIPPAALLKPVAILKDDEEQRS